MLAILGLAMIYAWGHGVVIVGKKITGVTPYERVVLIVGLVTFILFLIGSLS